MGELFISLGVLPALSTEFVIWVDVMGTKSVFKESNNSATLFILKLFKSTFLSLQNEELNSYKLYPVMDGYFLTHDDPEKLIAIIKKIFIQIANEFIVEKKPGYKFMIRAGLARGTVMHGDAISDSAEISFISPISKSLLFGKGVVDAVEAEKGAPPFSITIHEKSRKWFEMLNIKTTKDGQLDWLNSAFDSEKFKHSVNEYYQFRDEIPSWVDYPEEKKVKHLAAFLKMINDFKDNKQVS